MRKTILQNIRVVLCKIPLVKTPNIREMRQFWKSAILQRLYPVQTTILKIAHLEKALANAEAANAKNMRKTILQEH